MVALGCEPGRARLPVLLVLFFSLLFNVYFLTRLSARPKVETALAPPPRWPPPPPPPDSEALVGIRRWINGGVPGDKEPPVQSVDGPAGIGEPTAVEPASAVAVVEPAPGAPLARDATAMASNADESVLRRCRKNKSSFTSLTDCVDSLAAVQRKYASVQHGQGQGRTKAVGALQQKSGRVAAGVAASLQAQAETTNFLKQSQRFELARDPDQTPSRGGARLLRRSKRRANSTSNSSSGIDNNTSQYLLSRAMNDGRKLLRASGSDPSIGDQHVRVPNASMVPGCPVFSELLSEVEHLVSHETSTKYVGLWAHSEGKACYGGGEGEGGATSHAIAEGLRRCLAPNTDLLLAYKAGAPSSMTGLLALHPEPSINPWLRNVCPEVRPKYRDVVHRYLGIRSIRAMLAVAAFQHHTAPRACAF